MGAFFLTTEVLVIVFMCLSYLCLLAMEYISLFLQEPSQGQLNEGPQFLLE